MKKEELINTTRRNLGLSTKDKNFELLEGIWNAAIKAAAESAKTETVLVSLGKNEYPKGSKIVVDKHSILNLKFDKDENK